MAITYTIKLNNTSLPKLRAYKVGRNKLWNDAGRNMSGSLRATLTGLFPKIILEFAPTTADEMQTINGLLDQAFFTVSWWDSATKSLKSGQYYASDYETPLLNLEKELYDGFAVNLVPVDKLS